MFLLKTIVYANLTLYMFVNKKKGCIEKTISTGGLTLYMYVSSSIII